MVQWEKHVAPLRRAVNARQWLQSPKKNAVVLAADTSTADNSFYEDSLAGALARKMGRDVAAIAIGDTLDAQAAALKTIATQYAAARVFWILGSDAVNQSIGSPRGTPLNSVAGTAAKRAADDVRAAFLAANIPLTIVALPSPQSISPFASMWMRTYVNHEAIGFDQYQGDAQILKKAAGATAVDLFAPFLADQRSSNPQLLFGTRDATLTQQGAALAAEAIARNATK